MRQTSWRKWLLRRLWSHDLDITSGVREGLGQALEEGKGEQLSYRQPTEMFDHRAHAGGCDPLSLQGGLGVEECPVPYFWLLSSKQVMMSMRILFKEEE